MTLATRASPPRRSGVLAWALWALAMLGLPAVIWLDHLLREAGRPDLVQLADSAVILPVLGATCATTVGAVLASRRSRHPVGWLLLASGALSYASGAGEAYANYGLLARPGAVPAASSVALYLPVTAATGLVCIGFVLLLTPTGSPPSSGWRWWARVTAAAPVASVLAITLAPESSRRPYRSAENPLDLRGFGGAVQVTYQLAYAVGILAVMVAAASLVVRFRRASGTERQQLRWVALAANLVVPAAAVVLAGLAMQSPALTGWAGGAVVAILPLAIGAAILRYRLYDLDRIITRTLAYGVLTMLLGGAYAGLVLGLGQLLGKQSSLVVAGATLALAAAFQPTRRRIQDLVDRRFNRRRYDTARTIDAFAGRLRQQIDLDALTAELLAVVDRTMQPMSSALWLRSNTDGKSPVRPSPPPTG
jgi:hypothetical protein